MGKLGSLVVALLFIIIGGAGAGGAGVALLPTYWQYIGALFPPRHAIELYRNVRYFDGNNIVTPIAVLLAYGLVSLVVIVAVTRRSTPASEPATDGDAVAADGESARPERRRLVPKDLIAPVAFSLILTTLFAVNYMSSGHEPIANDMPFGVVGSTALAEAAQGDLFDLDITQYDDQDAATQAMDRGEIYGALITSDSSTELMVVNTISDISPLDIAGNFEQAAASAGETISVKAYAPTPLAPKDPFALVPATLLVVLLIGGYMSAALLTTAVGSASSTLARCLAGRVRGGHRSAARHRDHLLARRIPGGFVLGGLAHLVVDHPGRGAVRRSHATAAGPCRDRRHVDRHPAVRQPVVGRVERGRLSDAVLGRHRPVPAATQRVPAASQHAVLRRQRHRPTALRAARLCDHRRCDPRLPRLVPVPRAVGSRTRRRRRHPSRRRRDSRRAPAVAPDAVAPTREFRHSWAIAAASRRVTVVETVRIRPRRREVTDRSSYVDYTDALRRMVMMDADYVSTLLRSGETELIERADAKVL